MAQPTFCNISVPSTVTATLEDAYYGYTSEKLILDFIESATEGCKFSFSWKESKSAYCVALTLPDFRTEDAFVCATFWSDELYDALLEAHIVLYRFEAARAGFYHAKSEISKYEKEIAKAFKRFQEEGNTPLVMTPRP